MDTTCLEQLVGLDDCTTGHEFSLNQIGFSPLQIEDFLDDSYQNVGDMVTAMRKVAARQIVSDSLGALPTGVKVNGTIETNTAGIYQDNKQIRQGGQFRGIRIESTNSGEFVSVTINRISLLVNFTGNVNVLIKNLTDGTNYGTVTVAAIAGELIQVPCEIKCYSRAQNIRIAVIYDATGIDSYSCTIANNGCSTCGGVNQYSSRYVSIVGITANSPFLRNNTSTAQHTGGLAIEYSINCAPEAWLCNIRHLLGTSMLYGTAVAILEYGMNSGSQFSHQKTVNAQGNETRYERAQFQYQEHLKRAMTAAKYPLGVCFECRQNIGVINRLPG